MNATKTLAEIYSDALASKPNLLTRAIGSHPSEDKFSVCFESSRCDSIFYGTFAECEKTLAELGYRRDRNYVEPNRRSWIKRWIAE